MADLSSPFEHPRLLIAKVMHKRLRPRINAFVYGAYYLGFPLSAMDSLNDGWRFGVNRRAVMQFNTRDHGYRDDRPLETWAFDILDAYGLARPHEIFLVTLPRVLGYVFNPVSFWLCLDKEHRIQAVLCEVNNTFGETHTYLCRHADHRPITQDDWLTAEKVFHVSPFMARTGRYCFRFSAQKDHWGVWIDYYDSDSLNTPTTNDEKPKLITSLVGNWQPYDREKRTKAFWRYPWIPLWTILLIHYQAIKIIMKKIPYIPKPPQMMTKHTVTDHPQPNHKKGA